MNNIDSGDKYLEELHEIAVNDAKELIEIQKEYGNSWKQRGGVGAFMMFARKFDRLENRLQLIPTLDGEVVGSQWDLFAHAKTDQRNEGIMDDIKDLRRYLLLAEAEINARIKIAKSQGEIGGE